MSKTTFKDVIVAFKETTQTRERRLDFVLKCLFALSGLYLVVYLIAIAWQIFAILFVALAFLAIVTSPAWIWILRGKK